MEKLKMHSPNITDENIEKIREMFPGCVTEEKDESGQLRYAVDFDQLRQELSDHIVDGPQERYRLDWPGKREALLAANAPIAKTLRPCREESVNYDTTQNLFIEGDNLESAKLLQENYLRSVKMIYMDPPYNTGNDFVYNDRFSSNIDDYLRQSNQIDDEGQRLLSNPVSYGRFHSAWLSMMYPRLRLARNLLRDDGIILISIDDGEKDNLKKICDEIFGHENFIASFIWKSRQNVDNRTNTGASIDHEYILCFGNSIRGAERKKDQYTNPDNDPRGDWASANMVGIATADRRPNLHYDLINPKTGINYGCPAMGWRYEPATMTKLIDDNRILWPASFEGRPRRKAFISEVSAEFTGFSSIIGKGIFTRDGTSDMMDIFGERVFSFPKPVDLMKILIEQCANNDDIIVDFFAGSASTAHAVLEKNESDGARRRFIMLQMPEALDKNDRDQKTAFDFCVSNKIKPNIAELSKERIRRAGLQIKGRNPEDSGIDCGFRVLKVDTSNMSETYYTPDKTDQAKLLDAVENVKPDRTDPEDLLFQVLVDWGVDLMLPIRKEAIQGKTAFFVNEKPYDLIACFDRGVTEELVKELAKHEPMRVVFRDNGFVSDAVKINVEQIFKQLSPATDVKSI